MNKRYGYSSELYPLDPKDLINLPDTKEQLPKSFLDKINGEVVILIGDHRVASKDTLIQGREIAERAIKDSKDFIPVRIAFEIHTPRFDFFSTLMKRRREKYRGYCSEVYHISPKAIRDMNLERNIRTPENAYDNTKKKWYLAPEEREQKFKKLCKEIEEKGYSDKYPIEIMLRRSFGVLDTLQQGHHRMAICIELGIEKIAVRFGAAGQTKGIFAKLLMPLARGKMRK